MPVSDEATRAIQSAGVPGNCRPSVIQRPESKSLGVCRLFPWCPLPHIVSAAKLWKRSQEGLSEDACHLWAVEVMASSVRLTLSGCGGMLTAHHTQFTRVSELCHFGKEAI